ncbi:MAG: hypothetical protein RI885_1414 [Actinomycetota bacterium]
MDTAELLEVLSADGLRLLDGLPPWSSTADPVRRVSDLRAAGHSAPRVSAVLAQSRLRAKAGSKLGAFADRMLFTEAGLEQATRLRVAALHAGRFRDAGIGHVVDLGCGIGADALAFAGLDLRVTAVEVDEVTAAIAAYNLAAWPTAEVVHADALEVTIPDGSGVWLDPARRTAGHANTSRLRDPAQWSPTLDWAFEVGMRHPTGVKLGPGVDRELIPTDAEAQWVSVDREVVEVGVWFGATARQGVRRAAMVLGEHGAAELTAGADSADVEVRGLGRYLYEPDGAVIRARLIGDLARTLDAGMLSAGIAYLTADDLIQTPFAQAFRVLESFAFDERVLKRELAARRIGSLEIKKRGVDVDPAVLRRKLALRGSESATLVVTRLDWRHRALLVERV